jgi:hypothetical protein
MSSEQSSSNRKTSITRLDTIHRFLETSSSPTCLTTGDETGTTGLLSLTEPFPQPAHVHIRESSPSIKGYLDSVSPCATGTASTSSAVSRKNTSKDVIGISAPPPLAVTVPQRVPRRICSAFFVYFVRLCYCLISDIPSLNPLQLCGWGDGGELIVIGRV